MNTENPPINIENLNEIPTADRAAFQRFLLQSIRGERPADKDLDEWRKETLKLSETYAIAIGEIMDNKENTEIRNLIMAKNYKAASELIMEMLGIEKNKAA